jgi:hypothetical protein
VFEADKEFLVKHVQINVPSRSERETSSEDWNIVCDGFLTLDRETSTARFDGEPQ